jgi:GGDEF domain-containing protein
MAAKSSSYFCPATLANPEHALALVSAFGATPFEFRTHVFYVSCSFGVVVVQPAAVPVSLEQLLSLADEMLYRAKRAGRNRAEIVAFPRAGGPIEQKETAPNRTGTTLL